MDDVRLRPRQDKAAVREQELNPETQALIDTFSKLSRRSYASGLGALYAYESQFPGGRQREDRRVGRALRHRC